MRWALYCKRCFAVSFLPDPQFLGNLRNSMLSAARVILARVSQHDRTKSRSSLVLRYQLITVFPIPSLAESYLIMMRSVQEVGELSRHLLLVNAMHLLRHMERG